MKILIIGSGGREHALGQKLLENSKVTKLYFASGNGGTSEIGENIALKTAEDLKEFALENKVDLTIVGSEELLVYGIVDTFEKAGLSIFGPNAKAAKLEGSKVFAKEFMQKYGIKTAAYKTFTGYWAAHDYLKECPYPTVIKASGLAAGKGVIIAQNEEEAQQAIKEIMKDKIFGEAGDQVVIEEFLEGKEASILSVFNGKEIVNFISAKDHKKIGEGETGLNTGGMGVIAPNPFVTDQVMEAYQKGILEPTLEGLKAEDLLFAGVIFFGLMITEKGVYLLEYNLRMGDPETQAVLPLMDSDLVEIIEKAIAGESFEVKWKAKHSCCVVLVSGGYPLNYDKGFEIKGLDKLDTDYYVAGAKKNEEGNLITSGGRVLNIVGFGDSLAEAQKNAYDNVDKVHFDYKFFREDIGK